MSAADALCAAIRLTAATIKPASSRRISHSSYREVERTTDKSTPSSKIADRRPNEKARFGPIPLNCRAKSVFVMNVAFVQLATPSGRRENGHSEQLSARENVRFGSKADLTMSLWMSALLPLLIFAAHPCRHLASRLWVDAQMPFAVTRFPLPFVPS